MPIYEYTCRDCGQRFDVLRPMKDADAPVICKHCHGSQTKRTLSVFYASSEGRPVAAQSCGCGDCSGSGAACSSCRH